METLERSRVCRLCGKQAGMSIDIFGKRGNHVKKINMVLPILVHELDLLPKHMCHPCNYKLQEFHKFYEDCLKTDANLKSQLSWMQGSEIREEIIVPMVQINNMKIKSEPFDYEDQGLTGAVFNAANMANYEQNHYLFGEKFLQISDSRCSRCGCFCGNRNYGNNEISKKCSTIQEKTHKRGTITNDAKFSSRDMIRRNLFATEIFDKNPTLRTEISLCNEKKAFFQEKAPDNEVDLITGLDRLNEQQNDAVVTPKIEISENTSPKISSRVLRPRKKVTTNLPKSRSSSDPTRKSNKSTSREIARNKHEVNVPILLEIKIEAADECERSLRPRPQVINYYSESKRKIPKVRIEKMKILSDDLKLENLKKELVNEPTELPKLMDLETPISSSKFVSKVEREDETDKMGTNKNRKLRFRSRNNQRKASSVKIKKEILKAEFSDLISTKKHVKCSASKAPLFKSSNDKTVDKSKRKNSPKSYRESTLCLRSQIGSLRNKKLRKFHLLVDGPKKTQNKDISPRSYTSDAIKTESIEINAQNPGTILRYYNCGVCEKRFASHELYRLHDCYNKRH